MPSCAAGSRRKMLIWRANCGSCTAAASRAATRRNLFSMPDVDGGLVGGASLSADEFQRDLRGRGRVRRH